MQKPMLLALLFCRKSYCWRIYVNLQSCFQKNFQLVFYTSLTLRHCNTLSSISNSPTTKATFPINDFLCSPHLSIACLLYFIKCTRCDIEPYLVTFILRILLLQHSQLHSCLLPNSKLTQFTITDWPLLNQVSVLTLS